MPGQFTGAVNQAFDARARINQAKKEGQLAAQQLRNAAVKEQNAERQREVTRKAASAKEFDARFTKVKSAIPGMKPDDRGPVFQDLQRLQKDFPDQDLGLFSPGAFSERFGLEVPASEVGGSSPPLPSLPADDAGAVPLAGRAAARLPNPADAERVAEFDETRKQWGGLANDMAKKYGVPVADLLAIAQIESRGDASVSDSSADAKGLMQMTQIALDDIGMSDADMSDPAQAMEAAAKYYKKMLDRFGDNRFRAVAAYNAGPTVVANRWASVQKFPETSQYLRLFTALTGADTNTQDLADATRVLAAYPAYMQAGYGDEDLYNEAVYGDRMYDNAINLLNDAASRAPNVGDWQDVMRSPELYATARASVLQFYDNVGLSDTKIAAAMTQLDKSATSLQAGVATSQVEMDRKVDQIRDQVDLWFIGTQTRGLEAGMRAKMMSMSAGTIGDANGVREWMERQLSANPEMDFPTLKFLAADKFANIVPGFQIADVTRMAAEAGDAVPVTVPIGPYRDLFTIYPRSIYGTRQNAAGGVELEIPGGQTAVFDTQEDAAAFLKTRSLVFTPGEDFALPTHKKGPTPATEPIPAKGSPAVPRDVSVSVKPNPAGAGAVAVVMEGNKRTTRIFPTFEDAQTWVETLGADRAAAFRSGQPAPTSRSTADSLFGRR